MNEEFEEIEDWFAEDYERAAKEYEEWRAEALKRSLKDYKEFRHHSNIPYDCVKDWLEGMEYMESVGFISGFNEVCRYGKTYYQIRQEEVQPLKDALPDKSIGWFGEELFEVQTGSWDVLVPELDTEDEIGYRTVEWTEYVDQRTEWEDSYYGFIAFSMTDGRYWLLYFKC